MAASAFPFTDPSLELEVFFQDDWLEVLGSGVIQQQILHNCDLNHTNGWAFGLGLERLAMVLFDIPDIRLFWSEDSRFNEQFRPGEVTKFKPFSKYPPCYKDVTFWKPENFHENDLCDKIRGVYIPPTHSAQSPTINQSIGSMKMLFLHRSANW